MLSILKHGSRAQGAWTRFAMMVSLVLMTAVGMAADGKKAGGTDVKPPETAQKQVAPAQALVNINTANLGELQKLPRVGVKTAQRIIDFRAENGKFQTVEELMNVKGIGEKTFDRLKPLITI
ncbi:ComEA family DNA-binding protein [Acanthopleuribacter pedis]|uniref:Helix-hairpin-helix domain-containing protein n=1 Tax=Acanthopleuribacter pedis TaxID=442870 RepID=A0A8J7PYJ7_9BACT|nr:helix-hairpin-helix domain-containing protein [Acanthopleuribacter pedis]MBO1317002.1 helix-hairpin-helix domain-containing protein [Acanthopleuribacter pedis]